MEQEQGTPTDADIKDYNNRVKKLTKHALKYITRPFEYKEKFLEILQEGEMKRIISYEYAERKRTELIHKMNSPSRMKSWVQGKMQSIKKKLSPSKIQEIKSMQLQQNAKEDKQND